MAVNVHWISKDTDTVETKLLACERLYGVVDNGKIANVLLEIFHRYGILEKVVAVTTDNGADFIAALNNFGDSYSSYEEFLEERDDEHVWSHDNNDDRRDENIFEMPGSLIDESDPDNDEAKEMIPSNEIISNGANVLPQCSNELVDPYPCKVAKDCIVLHDVEDIENAVALEFENRLNREPTSFLPIRVACAAHTLNLVGKTDSYDALLNKDYAEVYFSVIKKLNIIWDTSNRSRKNCELVEKYLNRRIIKPHRIRWNRIFDAVIVNLSQFKSRFGHLANFL